MNKILLTLGLVSASFLGNSQIEIIQHGTTTNAGGTTVTHGITGDSEQFVEFDIKNTGATNDFKIFRRKIDVIDGAGDFYCWGLCFTEQAVTPNEAHLSEDETLASGEAKTFSAHYVPHGNIGDSRYRYYVLGDFNIAVDSVDVLFTSTAGLEDVAPIQMNVYPNPAQNVINVAADNSVAGEVVILNGLGQAVINQSIKGNTTIDISGLNNGVYFYSFISEGKSILTRKLVVKK